MKKGNQNHFIEDTYFPTIFCAILIITTLIISYKHSWELFQFSLILITGTLIILYVLTSDKPPIIIKFLGSILI